MIVGMGFVSRLLIEQLPWELRHAILTSVNEESSYYGDPQITNGAI